MSTEEGKYETSQTAPNMRAQVSSLLRLKKENRIIGKNNVTKLSSKIRKENLIIELRKECEYYEEEKDKREKSFESLTKLRNECEANKNEVTHYCDLLRDQLRDFVEKVDFYESEIDKLKEQRQQIIKTSEAILEKKRQEKAELEAKLVQINSKIDSQLNQITELNNKYEKFAKQKEEEKKVYLEEEAKDVDKYNNLFKKYREMLSKYNIYEQEEGDKEINNISSMRKVYEANLAKEELDIKLTEAKLKNENLQKDLEAISNKIKVYNKGKEEREKFNTLYFGKSTKGPKDTISSMKYSTIYTTTDKK